MTAISNILLQMAKVLHGMNLLRLGHHQIQLKSCPLVLFRFMKDPLSH